MSYPAPFDLTGQVGLVTGAGSGLGIEFAEVLADAGADVACADVDADAAADTAARVEKLGRRSVAITCDVADEQQVQGMVARTTSTLGRLDVLFANAGIADANPAPVHQFQTRDWHQVIDVDLHGVFYSAKHALEVMVAQGSGKIINIASMWGTTGSSSVFPIPAYSAAKGAVVNLTRELGLEYATAGIQVNALCPGFYRTRLAGGAYDDPDFVSAVTGFTPMGRVAEASEIRGPALFLASSASDYMTGQLLIVDGGCMAK
ncbi:SDR family NAD(P)-dependent oxidoreductase [Pseudonocardia endophytica]|uniref:Gluconate 5-dehydrogenase/2-deoxy-D-gluconate 3-dehydrogenase n=1 Tax=Pseudonocardia endophytica TaxID=401976 RepID=A0A4V2PIW6_PSEEN|nr:SDR family oxidoreductase [Pseudonocardia endophytica]TCK26256.1 gluconate 5-dehydrogenase/2-deoxy-D-gluconate 3-dehydrogenase [Pseudonocardia endophytica]